MLDGQEMEGEQINGTEEKTAMAVQNKRHRQAEKALSKAVKGIILAMYMTIVREQCNQACCTYVPILNFE